MKKKIKILHLEASKGWGGQEIRILKESQGMQKRGYEIFFAISKGGLLIEKLKKEGFKKIYEVDFRKRKWVYSFFVLSNIIKENDIDIINTHSSQDAWLGGMVGKLLKKPIIRTRHLSTRVKGGLNSYFLYNFLVNYVITTCEETKVKIIKQSKKNKKYFSSIPTGVDPNNMFIEDIHFRKKIEISEKDFLVGTCCFLRCWKGIEDFLEAANILRNNTNIKWLIIGEGETDKYEKIAKRKNLKNVIFTGYLENPFSAMNSLDIFLLLSTAHEGVSQAMLQAAYLEKPLIGTNIGGIFEVCIDKKTGFLVPPFNPEKIVKAILEMKNNDKMRREMSINAKRLVLDKFSFEKMLDDTENIYFNILK
ncbi:MAG: hypothetical protein AMS24_02120 [Chlamydiae bacterium SM23_39]|nr:MAG: hypothetical protein AMS24_02120 [Chlamydiae bacterium SM23_39]